MTRVHHTFPSLDDMLHSLLLVEKGEHELTAKEEGVEEIRQIFFPVTRTCVYLNHAANGPLPYPVVQAMHEFLDDVSRFD
jgi:hypothetical protein